VESELLQLADLFSDSVARIANKASNGSTHPKDRFAAFFEKVAGFPFTQDAAAGTGSDFVFVRYLTGGEA
jgi:hypothetical protein